MSYNEKKAVVATALAEIDPTQPFGTELFNAIAAVSVSVALETVCLQRDENGRIEVLLLRRGLQETFPGLWHSPGTIIRPREELTATIERIEMRELGGTVRLGDRPNIWNNPVGDDRGHTLHLIYACRLDRRRGDDRGVWFPVADLPKDIIDYHLTEIIPRAVRAFEIED